MLQSIRDYTHGWIAGVIISLLIFSFALWGIHSYLLGAGSNDVAAKVNGTQITKNQLAVAYERLRRQLQMQTGSTSLPSTSETNLKERALQNLINFQVLEQASLANDYRITTNQIDGFLQSLPDFQVNGKFSVSRFQQIISAMMFNIPDFIDMVKTTLLIDQPRLGIIFTSLAMPNEINETMALIGQERELRYLLIPQSYVAHHSVIISKETIEAYYAKHQDQFKTPEQVSVDYILLSAKDLANKINPTEEELKNFYSENSSSFSQPYDQVKNKVKQLLASQKSEEELANKKEKMANLTYEHPESLQIAAKELGLPINTTELFSKEKGEGHSLIANEKIREIAFSNEVLNLQNNSDVIPLTPESFIVLRIKKHIPASVLPLSAVQQLIEGKLKAAALEENLTKLGTEIKDKLQAGTLTPEQVSAEYHLSWKDTGFVGRHTSKVDQGILDRGFAMPLPPKDKITYATTKVANGFAVVGLMNMRQGNVNVAKEQYQAYVDQVQTSLGTLEYQLYKDSLINKAKIVIES